MKLPLGAALEARTIGAPAVGKWSAEVCVPTTKNSRHEISELYCYPICLHDCTSFKIAFVSITRKLSRDWATKFVLLYVPFCSFVSGLYLALAQES
jgi:hypothetical protein